MRFFFFNLFFLDIVLQYKNCTHIILYIKTWILHTYTCTVSDTCKDEAISVLGCSCHRDLSPWGFDYGKEPSEPPISLPQHAMLSQHQRVCRLALTQGRCCKDSLISKSFGMKVIQLHMNSMWMWCRDQLSCWATVLTQTSEGGDVWRMVTVLWCGGTQTHLPRPSPQQSGCQSVSVWANLSFRNSLLPRCWAHCMRNSCFESVILKNMMRRLWVPLLLWVSSGCRVWL